MKSKNRVPNQNFLGILCHKTTWIHLARLSYVIYDNKYRYICLYLMCRRVLRRTRASNLRSHLLHFSRMDGGMEEKKQEYRLTLYVGQYIEVLMAKANVPPNVTTKCSIQTRYGHYYVFTVVPTTVKIYEFFQTVCFKGN